MANTTSEYWAINGQSLQTFAYNIESWGDSRQGVPPTRGDDLVVPFRSGRIFMPKTADSRTITLAMWVGGADSDGRVPQGGVARQLFEDNWTKLRSLLWGDPSVEFFLSKTVFRTIGGVRTAIPVTAKASFGGGLEPQMTGGQRARFTVDLFLADPWFYADTSLQRTFTAANQTWNIPAEAAGDVATDAAVIQFTGSWSNPTLTNLDNVGGVGLTTAQVSVKFGGALGTSQIANTVTLSCVAQQAFDGNNRPVAGLVSHQGSRSWFEVKGRVAQTIRFTASSGTGTALLAFSPRYF